MMRQSLSLLLVVMTALALSACGQDADGSPATVNRTYKLADAASSSSGGPDGTQSDAPPSRTCPLLYYPDSTGSYLVSRELSGLSLSDQTLDVKLGGRPHRRQASCTRTWG